MSVIATTIPASETAGGAFYGERRAWWRLLLRGAVWLALTLGLYRFWLITDIRRLLWSNTSFNGDALEYNGTPLELLTGFLVAIALLIPLYASFFLLTLDFGPFGELSGAIVFAALFLLGQYAIFRSRRYRLTRSIYRGLRFHQTGSAALYALRATLWWILSIVTLGLAYPFQLASLERYKMRHTHYGDLDGGFAGSGFGLFLRGIVFWLIIIAPFAVTIGAFLEVVDWQALADAASQGDEDLWARIEVANPELAAVAVFGAIMTATGIVVALLVYPVFQAIAMRWWLNGLSFGPLTVRSTLKTRQVYGAYARFALYLILFAILMAIIGGVALVASDWLIGRDKSGVGDEILATLILLAGYVTGALGLSTLYRATVMVSLWKLCVETLTLSHAGALDHVTAAGHAASPIGEGLADALNVGTV